jgi:dihydroorotase-like cyclic amidohydrolase
MQAAVAGGVTSLVCPPDTDPPLDEPGLVEMLKFRARSLDQARVYPLGALTQGLKGERLTEMAELHDAGCVAFGQPGDTMTDNQVLMRSMVCRNPWTIMRSRRLARGPDNAKHHSAALPNDALPVLEHRQAIFT